MTILEIILMFLPLSICLGFIIGKLLRNVSPNDNDNKISATKPTTLGKLYVSRLGTLTHEKELTHDQN